MCSLSFDGLLQSGACLVHLLQGDSPDAYNDIDQPECVHPEKVRMKFQDGCLTLPAAFCGD